MNNIVCDKYEIHVCYSELTIFLLNNIRRSTKRSIYFSSILVVPTPMVVKQLYITQSHSRLCPPGEVAFNTLLHLIYMKLSVEFPALEPSLTV